MRKTFRRSFCLILKPTDSASDIFNFFHQVFSNFTASTGLAMRLPSFCSPNMSSAYEDDDLSVAALTSIAGAVSSLLALLAVIQTRKRGNIVQRPASKITAYYEKMQCREDSWFKKHCRVTCHILDRMCEDITPQYHFLHGVPHHNTQFDIKVFYFIRFVSLSYIILIDENCCLDEFLHLWRL